MIFLHCRKCQWTQTPLEVATNIAHPQACLNCGHDTFLVSSASILEMHKLERDNTNMHMIIDGAYS